ncbi:MULTISPECIES: hypothetical protein [unclassified Streptomyces]|uniref:hypothetical protein n=1 Tax=unclassified Streptomyces TaxID=2593676 RepID=UPI001B365EC6|nr:MULTISPECIES: hypothetical protein [unclassified Streptomyces]MBQ0949262.1 hypothetical protein [Streptomyces sp. RK76]MDX3405171.1 hypothetical protein [Streptomyces sp. ME02-6977A]
MSVTIKYSGDKDATWAVFKGTTAELRSDIMDYFGMDPATQAGLSLSSIVTNATQIAHGKGLIATALGASVIEETTTEPAKPTDDPWAAASAAQSSGPWPGSASVTEPKKEDPNAYILGEIEKQTTVDGLKKLWAGNQSFFSDAGVMAAWKAKGKALQAAA